MSRGYSQSVSQMVGDGLQMSQSVSQVSQGSYAKVKSLGSKSGRHVNEATFGTQRSVV